MILLLALACVPRPGEATDLKVDEDGDGFVVAYDCDDADAAVHPEAEERCDGVDEDCDGEVDEDPVDARAWYLDADDDGAGDVAAPVSGCSQPAGSAANDNDCDDADAAIHPDAAEVCDGVDNNCDLVVDEDAIDRTTWYTDADGDGFGGSGDVVIACEAPSGMALLSGDCADTEPAVYPGAAEVCDGLDNDCDGSADLGAADAPKRYADLDSDGFGDPLAWIVNCEGTNGTVDDASDCDDHDATRHPGADEVCDEEDDDCDGAVDEDAVDAPTWFVDGDGDGIGAAAVDACAAPVGAVAEGGDCDDADATVGSGC